MHYLELFIQQELENQEIKKLLYEELHLSTRKIRMLKQNPQGILLDGLPAGVRQQVKTGQRLQVLLEDSSLTERIIPVKMALEILYEDEDLLLVNKPSGLVCHPSRGHLTDSLCNGIAAHFQDTGQSSAIHLLGRLDKDTSGIVAIAKNKVAAERMNKKDSYEKEYLALVKGVPEKKEGDILIPMEEDRSEGYLKMRTGKSEKARPAVTHYTVLETIAGGCLCRVTIGTGRTHQIRFHMAAIGHPLLGDSLYNPACRKEESQPARAALHAFRLRFLHPFTGEQMDFTADLPEDMEKRRQAL